MFLLTNSICKFYPSICFTKPKSTNHHSTNSRMSSLCHSQNEGLSFPNSKIPFYQSPWYDSWTIWRLARKVLGTSQFISRSTQYKEQGKRESQSTWIRLIFIWFYLFLFYFILIFLFILWGFVFFCCFVFCLVFYLFFVWLYLCFMLFYFIFIFILLLFYFGFILFFTLFNFILL